MKAMVYHNYGSPDTLELAEIDQPVARDNEVLVEVCAASVNWHDWHFLTGTPVMAHLMAGLLKPKNKVLGIDAAGRVEAVGKSVRRFRPGDEVFGSGDHGCFAKYVCLPEESVVGKPPGLSFEEAAAVPAAAVTALHALRDHGQVLPGQKVLINGASGGVGTFAVQIARAFGTEVTGVCSTGNLDLLRSIGANGAIDYTREDFTQNGKQYDLIFDVAAKRSFAECKRVLHPKGMYITSEFSPQLALAGLWTSWTGDRKMVALPPKPPNQADQAFIAGLLEGGKVTPVIGQCYSLSEVPEAIHQLAEGHTRGKIVITV